MSELATIKDLLEEEIKDLYSAEKQLTKAIPKMAKGANNEELSAAFEAHLKETERQIDRLEQVAKLLGTTTSGQEVAGASMEGVIARGRRSCRTKTATRTCSTSGIIGAGKPRGALRDRGLHDGDQPREATAATTRLAGACSARTWRKKRRPTRSCGRSGQQILQAGPDRRKFDESDEEESDRPAKPNARTAGHH